MKRLPKTMLLKLGVFLLLGAIVNVAVAWGCALIVDVAKGTRDPEDLGYYSKEYGPCWMYVIHSRVGAKRWSLNVDHVPSYHAIRVQPLPKWVRPQIDVVEAIASLNPLIILDEARGWPMLAMHCRAPVNATQTGVWPNLTVSWAIMTQGGILVGSKASNQGTGTPRQFVSAIESVRTFPLLIIWPGFAINTIFYAAILWLLWIAPGRIRRFVRIRGHRCPACGFIIAPNTCANGLCSECGARLPRSLRRSEGM